MAEENIRTTLQFQADITDFKSAMQEANRSIKLANSEFKAASSGMDDWGSSTDGLSAKLNQLAAVHDAEKRKLDVLQAAYQKAVAEQGAASAAAADLQTKINNQQAVINKTQKELDQYSTELKEVEEAERRAAKSGREVSEELDDMRKKAEESAEGWSILKDVIADFVSNAIDWAIESFKELMTAGDNALATLGARTGATADQMARYKDVMNEIYRSNFGESFDDVADAMGIVVQTFGDLDKASLQNITQKAIALRDTFGFDYQESMRTVNSMMDQFGVTADEAFNLIAQGAQKGLDQNGDLLDTINEYSVQFANAGYSADDMFNMLKNGADNGTWSVDKLGDAMKEFGIRAKDESESTANAFSMLGYSVGDSSKAIAETKEKIAGLEKQLKYAKMEQEGFNKKTSELTRMKNADKIAEYSAALETAKGTLAGLQEESGKTGKSFEDWEARFAAGGESAKEATAEMLQALLAIDDPVKQNTAGVALFGTMWEDLGPKAIEALLQTEGGIDKTKAAMDNLTNTKYDTLSSAMEGLGRVIQTDLLQPIADKLAPIIKDLVEWAIENMPTIAPIVTGIATAVGVLASALAIQGLISGVTKAFALLNGTMALNPIVLVVAAIAGLVAAFVALWNKSEAFRNFWKNLWEGIKNTVAAVAKWFSTTASDIAKFFSDAWTKIKNAFANVGGFFSDVWSKISGAFSSVASWFGDMFGRAWSGIKNAFANVGGFFSDVWSKIKSVFSIDGMLSIGKNLVTGLWNGISNSFTWIKNKISGWVGNVMDFIKGLFGIHSPSAVMRDEVGKMLGLGMAEGIEDSRNAVNGAVRKLGDAALGGLSPVGGGAPGAAAGGRSINFTQNNYSPRALSRREIYRQTHNALVFAGGV